MDLRRIARDTRAVWGEEQAKRYVGRLRTEIKSLREFPERFPEFDEKPELRRMNSGKHAVFYQVGTDRVEIIRVLHVASDFERWV